MEYWPCGDIVSPKLAWSWSCNLFKFWEMSDFSYFGARRAVPLHLQSFLFLSPTVRYRSPLLHGNATELWLHAAVYVLLTWMIISFVRLFTCVIYFLFLVFFPSFLRIHFPNAAAWQCDSTKSCCFLFLYFFHKSWLNSRLVDGFTLLLSVDSLQLPVSLSEIHDEVLVFTAPCKLVFI